MTKLKLVRVLDADVCSDVKTGAAVPCLQFEEPRFGCANVVGDGSDATLEELVWLCDQHAESVNAHDFCGTHRLVGAVLFRKLGRAVATEIMLEIARHGGLSEMSGICTKTDSYTELGVGKCGRDWHGTYGETPVC